MNHHQHMNNARRILGTLIILLILLPSIQGCKQSKPDTSQASKSNGERHERALKAKDLLWLNISTNDSIDSRSNMSKGFHSCFVKNGRLHIVLFGDKSSDDLVTLRDRIETNLSDYTDLFVYNYIEHNELEKENLKIITLLEKHSIDITLFYIDEENGYIVLGVTENNYKAAKSVANDYFLENHITIKIIEFNGYDLQ